MDAQIDEVFAPCDICNRDIFYGNAVLELSRNVEQHEYDEKTGSRSATVIDSAPLATICAYCANQLADRKEILTLLMEDLGLPTIPTPAAASQTAIEPKLICNCCTSAIVEKKARVSLVRLLAQVEWREDLEDSELIVLDGEDILSFCHNCGNKMNEGQLQKSVQALLDELISRCTVYDSGQSGTSPAKEEKLKELYENKVKILHSAINIMNEHDKKENGKWQKILEIGADGGSIILHGYKDDDGDWWFSRNTDERSMQGLLSDEDQVGLAFESFSAKVKGWDAALKDIYRYPWPCLYPLYVHPEFAEQVMLEIKKGTSNKNYWHIDVEHWERVCAGKSKW